MSFANGGAAVRMARTTKGAEAGETVVPFDPPAGGGLGARGVRASFHAVVFATLRFLIQTASLMLLARLLEPEDYGLVGMVATVTGFAALFRDMGLGAATIEKADLRHDDVNEAFWLNAAAGCVLTAALAAAAPLVARFYGEPRVAGATILSSVAFLASGAAVQHGAILRRRLKFFQLGLAETVSSALGLVAALALAAGGAGYWSLVAMPLAQEVSTCTMLWAAARWRPTRPRRPRDVRRLTRFGTGMMGINVLSYLSSNIDRVMIGRVLGTGDLGAYGRASALTLLPTHQITLPVASVMLPILSRLREHPERYRKVLLTGLRLMAAATAPVVAVLIACREWAVEVVLGPRWLPAAAVLAPLALVSATQFVPNNLGWALVVAGRFRGLIVWNLVHLAALAASMGWGIRWGLPGVAWAYAGVVTVMRLPVLFRMVASAAPVGMGQLWSVCLPFWAVAAALGAVAAVVKARLTSLGPIWGLVALSSGLVAVYVAALSLVPAGRDVWRDLKRVVHHLRAATPSDPMP